MKTTLVALTLNEIEGCKAVMPKIDLSRFDQVLILDGGSTDGTVEWCRAQGYEVYVQKKKGIRFAYLEALPLMRGDILVTISPDGNCAPETVTQVLDKALEPGVDLVIGSRYLGDAVSDDDDLITGFGNWLFTRTVNLLYGAKYTDAMVIFRGFPKSLIYELDLDKDESYELYEKLFGTCISWEPLMSVRAAKAKMNVVDVAVGEPPRIGGVRKLQFWRELWYWKPKSQRKAALDQPRS